MARHTDEQRKLISHLTTCQLCGNGGELHLADGMVVMCKPCYSAHRKSVKDAKKMQRRTLERRLNYLEAWKKSAEWILKQR